MALQYPLFAGNDRIQQAANNSPCMAFGERGTAVAILQAALVDLGYAMPITMKTGTPDGIYGSETKAVVLKFQTDQKLGKDGIAGRETFTRLDQLIMAKQKPPKKPIAKPKPPQVGPPPIPRDRNYKIGNDDPRITPDVGAGAWDSEPTEISTRIKRQLILETLPPRGVSSMTIIGDDAAMHMLHYMNNSGRDYTIDLEGMVAEVNTAKKHFENEVSQAKKFVETLPVGTHQITSRTAESSYNYQSETRNWFFAVGGYSTWGKGTAIVTDGPAGKEYELRFTYKFFDRYNWDGGKSITFKGITVTDEFMAEFHRQGVAREFNMNGSFERNFKWKQGDPIPAEQYLPRGGR